MPKLSRNDGTNDEVLIFVFKKISLTGWIFIGIILGAAIGLVGGAPIAPILSVPGNIFLRLLKMVIVPLIFTSITSGILGIGSSKNLGRLSLKTFFYYLLTSLIAILTGLVLVNLIQPGRGANLGFSSQVNASDLAPQSLWDIFYRMIPENPVAALVQGDILAIIFFSILLGTVITKLPDEPRLVLANLFNAGFAAMMKLTQGVIYVAPIGVFGLVGKITATMGLAVFKSLGLYFCTVAGGLVIHFFITLPLLIMLITRCRPYRHMKNMSSALLTAFTTASSSATLPLTLEAAEKKAGISHKIASFVLPLGATVNMDGTALYECVAAMYIAQVYGIDLTFGSQMIVVYTALLASIGAAGIPMAGLVMMTIVLRAVGLPLEGIGLILAVDQILDMMRTSTNVWSDAVCALIVAKSEGELCAGNSPNC